MTITVVPGHLLSRNHASQWSAIQRGDPALASPFLAPEFTRAVAAVRRDVHVAVLEDRGQIAGFFPYQRGRLSVGRPVGGWLNDLQAVVVRPGVPWSARELARACGLLEWKFGRLLAAQRAFEPFHLRRHTSLFIDVSQGYEAYLAQKREAGIDPSAMLRLPRKARTLARKVGPLRFEAHTSDTGVLATLMRWKFERYRHAGYRDAFAMPWARAVIEQLHAVQTPSFGGMLSVLYAGDQVAAAHMGLRSHGIWHFWFPAYNPELRDYSPGLMLLLHMAQHAGAAGPSRIELGGGDYPFKHMLANDSIELAEGAVDRVAGINVARRWARDAAQTIRQSRLLHPPARAVNGMLHGLRSLGR